APRGYTQWVRNAVASGTVSLKKRRRSEQFGIRILLDDEKPDPEVISRPLQADGAAVFPSARRLSDRSLSAIDRTVPDLRADTPTMNWAVLALRREGRSTCRSRATSLTTGVRSKCILIHTQRTDAVWDNFS